VSSIEINENTFNGISKEFTTGVMNLVIAWLDHKVQLCTTSRSCNMIGKPCFPEHIKEVISEWLDLIHKDKLDRDN